MFDYWVNVAAFCENYTKFYFDAKHLEKGLSRGRVKFLGLFFQKSPFFHKEVPFLANMKHCRKVLEYVLDEFLNNMNLIYSFWKNLRTM